MELKERLRVALFIGLIGAAIAFFIPMVSSSLAFIGCFAGSMWSTRKK